jgi:hypothetical protein
MRETKQVIICGVTITVGDIVKIKFKRLEDVLGDNKKYCRAGEVIDHYQISDHLISFTQGVGHFKVGHANGENNLELSGRSERIGKRPQRAGTKSSNQLVDDAPILEEIRVEDVNANGQYWTLNEVLIEEISVENDVADSYFSEDHQLSLVLIDSILYVNGAPLTSADSKIFEMFEKVLADAAINRCLDADFKDKHVDNNF